MWVPVWGKAKGVLDRETRDAPSTGDIVGTIWRSAFFDEGLSLANPSSSGIPATAERGDVPRNAEEPRRAEWPRQVGSMAEGEHQPAVERDGLSFGNLLCKEPETEQQNGDEQGWSQRPWVSGGVPHFTLSHLRVSPRVQSHRLEPVTAQKVTRRLAEPMSCRIGTFIRIRGRPPIAPLNSLGGT